MNKKKIILCLFGTIPRSIKYTYNSIKKHIIDALKENNYILEIFVFNLNTSNNKVDGKILNQADISIIPYDYYEEHNQTILDKELDNLYKRIKVSFINYYSQTSTINAIRQMYSEYRVGLFLEKNQYKFDIAIVCGPDFHIANKINIHDIENAYINNNFYTTLVNEGYGYTNGFYIGRPKILVKPLKRFQSIYKYLPTDKDYEYLLKQSIIENNITKNVIKIVFFKRRANDTFSWDGNISYLNESEKEEVKNEYKRLISYGYKFENMYNKMIELNK